MLDLVDEHGRAALEQPVVEGAGAVALELLLRRHVRPSGRAPRSAPAARRRARRSARAGCADRRRAAARGARSARSAPGSPARSPREHPVEERFVRLTRIRSSGSIPGGKVKVSPGSQVAAGKLRLRSTPAAFCLVPASRPSGLRTGITAQRVSAAGTRSSSRRTSSAVSASSPCWAAVRRPATGPSPAGRKTRSGTPSRERPYSSTRQPSSSLPSGGPSRVTARPSAPRPRASPPSRP